MLAALSRGSRGGVAALSGGAAPSAALQPALHPALQQLLQGGLEALLELGPVVGGQVAALAGPGGEEGLLVSLGFH